MSGDSILLDSNIVIAFFKGDTKVRDELLAYPNRYIALTVLGELYYGAKKSANPQKHLSLIEEFLKLASVIMADEVTAEHYGEIKTVLSRKGTLIPDNDIWIAAFALEYQFPLATRDAHFDCVEALQVLNW